MIRTFQPFFHILRPGQWIKNTFVLAPLIFAGQFLNFSSLFKIALTVLYFCIAASASYILNDILDLEKDRQHPTKKKTRPIATGDLQIKQAVYLLLSLYVLFLTGFLLIPKVMLIISLYLVLNFAYSYRLKRIPIIDIFTIAFGFVLRVYAGTIAIQVPLSPWMFITTFSLALYLAAIKRQQELKWLPSGETRLVLAVYTKEVLSQYAMMAAVCSIIFYSLFVLIANPLLIITIPLVLFGIFRYWLIVEIKQEGESPARVLYSDLPLLIAATLWGILCVYILWPHPI